MKKIKLKFTKKPLNRTPNLALLLLVEQRHKLTNLMLDWYVDMKETLKNEAQLSIFICSPEDYELKDQVSKYDATWIEISKGTVKGEQYNKGLSFLSSYSFDAIIPLFPGDFLTKKLLQKHIEHIQAGGLFLGLLDLHLFDPNEMKCMHWLRHEFTQGPQRVAPLGYVISTQLLKALKWRVWSNQNDQGGVLLHRTAMTRLFEVIQKCPKGSCLIQTQSSLEANAFSLKSEFGRAVFNEENWQQVSGLSFVDFETTFENDISESWMDRIQDFDERLVLDILVEDGEQSDLWREHYEYCIYKFLPYVEVRLHVISESHQFNSDWQVISPQGSQMEDRWNYALSVLRKDPADLTLFAGKASLVDLKTIEYYLIYVFKSGARLLSVQNFYLGLPQQRQSFFWKGNPASFEHIFGFGTCIHKTYLDALDWQPFGPKGRLNPKVEDRFQEMIHNETTRFQRVLFQCASNKLGLIAFDFEGAIGFEGKISMGDVIPVDLKEHITEMSYYNQMLNAVIQWADSETEETDQLATSSIPSYTRGTSMSTDSSTALSPLERAKALLQQSQSNPSSTAPTSGSSSQADQSLSPLERAKALLQKSQSSQPSTAPTSGPSSQEDQSLSPLERAKALLQKSQSTQSSSTPTAPSAPQTENSLSPLERAKALLQKTQDTSPKQESVSISTNGEQELSPIEKAKALLLKSAKTSQSASTDSVSQNLDHLLKATENMVSQLQAHVDQANEDPTPPLSKERDPNSPEEILCAQGEELFVGGHTDQAKVIFESALRVNPDCLRALNNLGVLALHNERPYEALSLFLIGLIQDAQDQDLLQNLAALFEQNPQLALYKYLIFDA